jgi:hypothetical protein
MSAGYQGGSHEPVDVKFSNQRLTSSFPDRHLGQECGSLEDDQSLRMASVFAQTSKVKFAAQIPHMRHAPVLLSRPTRVQANDGMIL